MTNSSLNHENQQRVRKLTSINPGGDSIDASVIVVTHGGSDPGELDRTLEALTNQTVSSYEAVIVDNGSGSDLIPILSRYDRITQYVQLKQNYGANVGRNVGANICEGDLLIFLDDDAIPARDFVEEHLWAYQSNDIVALRGRVHPKTPSFYNRLAPIYDYGDESFPYPIDIEGNCSVKRHVFFDIGGFNEDVWGHEGLDLTEKIINIGAPEDIIYYPRAVIYHDFATSFSELIKKKARHQQAKDMLDDKRPEVFDVYDHYTIPKDAINRSLAEVIGIHLANRTTDWIGSLLRRHYFARGQITDR